MNQRKTEWDVGDTVYCMSQYNGIVKRTIRAKGGIKGEIKYLLDRPVEFRRDGSSYGSSFRFMPKFDRRGQRSTVEPATSKNFLQIGDLCPYQTVLPSDLDEMIRIEAIAWEEKTGEAIAP